jgi:L-ascorbate metabolism protein UlaG (beta-lactamase superfamily)
MKITKYVHSCLLVEATERVGIIDPGQFSWESGLFDVASLERLDDIIITHEHFDHMYLPFIQALVAKFPNAQVTITHAAAAKLTEAGFANIQTKSSEGIELFATNHEPIAPLGSAPENVGVHYLGSLTHPGDSHHFTETKDILALPVTAPWGTLARAAELALELKPKYIIPIHDWHWNDAARNQAYDRLQKFFQEHGIEFIMVKDGASIEIY